MVSFILGIDILGLAVILGAILLLVAVLWVLIENRPLDTLDEEVERTPDTTNPRRAA